ncbi:hypothetical protein OAT67_03900 [Bacteriovoracaceae bacterium]|nr:hypothetical protein [Bacteriovoracaceae bacterium]
MKKLIIDLNNYESAEEIKRVALWWNEEMEADIKINRFNKMRLLPCQFKHVANEIELDGFEKLRLLKDGLNQILKLIEIDNQNSLYYTKNIECILELELRDTKLYDKYLNQIPAKNFWERKKLDHALREMRADWKPFLRLV